MLILTIIHISRVSTTVLPIMRVKNPTMNLTSRVLRRLRGMSDRKHGSSISLWTYYLMTSDRASTDSKNVRRTNSIMVDDFFVKP